MTHLTVRQPLLLDVAAAEPHSAAPDYVLYGDSILGCKTRASIALCCFFSHAW